MNNFEKEVAQAQWKAKQKKEARENEFKQKREKYREQLQSHIKKMIGYDTDILKNTILDMIEKEQYYREIGDIPLSSYEFGWSYGIRKKWQYETLDDIYGEIRFILLDLNKELEEKYKNLVFLSNTKTYYGSRTICINLRKSVLELE